VGWIARSAESSQGTWRYLVAKAETRLEAGRLPEPV
jgi:hypothetical protein